MARIAEEFTGAQAHFRPEGGVDAEMTVDFPGQHGHFPFPEAETLNRRAVNGTDILGI